MKQKLGILLMVIVLVGTAAACSLGPQVQSTATTQPVVVSNILFQDDFSDPKSGWHTLRERDQVVDYEQGGLRFYVTEPQFDYWSIPNLSFTDVHVEVTAIKLTGPDDNDFGVLCRYQDDQHFYGFLVSSDGYFGISKMVDGEHNLLGSQEMQPSEVINKGSTSNAIAVDCIGSKLSLTVNGTKLLEVEDADYASGDIGLLAGTFDTGGVDILFDNLVVTKPQ